MDAHLDHLDILVVDDDRDVLFLLDKVLGNAGARARTATSVESALAELAIAIPDVIISDLDMPTSDGYGFIRAVRALPDARAHVPAIALTAHNDDAHRNAALDAGFTAHLGKPMRAQQLVDAVLGIVGLQRRAVG